MKYLIVLLLSGCGIAKKDVAANTEQVIFWCVGACAAATSDTAHISKKDFEEEDNGE